MIPTSAKSVPATSVRLPDRATDELGAGQPPSCYQENSSDFTPEGTQKFSTTLKRVGCRGVSRLCRTNPRAIASRHLPNLMKMRNQIPVSCLWFTCQAGMLSRGQQSTDCWLPERRRYETPERVPNGDC